MADETSGNAGGGAGVESPSTFRELQHTPFFRLLVRGFLVATRHLPVWLLRSIGQIVVVAFIAFNFRNFRAIRRNLSRIRPGLSGAACSLQAFHVFRNYSYYLIDLFYLSHDASRISEYSITLSGLDNLFEALSLGKRIILLTSHLGNWEVGGLKLSSMKWDFMPEICVVYSPDSLSLLESQRRFVRLADGISQVPLREGEFVSLKLLRLLREGKMVALQGDRLMFDRGAAVKFFGHDAVFPKGPVKLASLTGSVIIPIFIPITGYKAYELIIEEPVAMESAGGEEEVQTNLSKIITIMEKYISRYATQWYTFMPFWENDKEEFNR